jgi:hypothetical protein
MLTNVGFLALQAGTPWSRGIGTLDLMGALRPRLALRTWRS